MQDAFDVSICNPPFFEIDRNRTDGYGGVQEELSTSGGEFKFIKQYMVESYTKRRHVKWFTSLVGIKSHLDQLLTFLTSNFPISEHLVTTLYQGKTLRWALAWKFTH